LNRKKISLYSLTTSYVESSISENSHFVHVLNSQLVNLGMKVKTITPHSMGLPKKETRNGVIINRFRYLPEKYQIKSLSIADAVKSKIGIFKMLLMSIAFFIFTFVECVREKPDIMNGHWAFPAGYTAVIMSKIFRINSVITVHGGEITLLRKFKFLGKIVVNSLNKSSIIFANSNYTKDRLIRLGVKKEKIIINKVPAKFVNSVSDKNSINQFRKKYVEPSQKIILFVGRLIEAKGVEYLIRALLHTQNKKIHLIIAGDGLLLDNLKKLTKSLDLESKVTFFGWATKRDLSMLFAISDLFVVPSIDTFEENAEGLGLVIPEAMNSGLPIIASSVGGIVDTVKNEVNGLLVEQKNPKALANAIDRIFSDEELKKKMIENSKETVKEFSPTAIARSYFDVFQSLVKN